MDVAQLGAREIVLVEAVFKGAPSLEKGTVERVGELEIAKAGPFEAVRTEIEKVEKILERAVEDEAPFGVFLWEDFGIEWPDGEVDGKGGVEIEERRIAREDRL